MTVPQKPRPFARSTRERGISPRTVQELKISRIMREVEDIIEAQARRAELMEIRALESKLFETLLVYLVDRIEDIRDQSMIHNILEAKSSNWSY